MIKIRRNPQGTKRTSVKQEKSVAKELDGKTTVASGALWGAKGDVRNSKFLIECKTTAKDYYVFTAKVWNKICREALKDHLREPLLIIDLNNDPKKRYVVFNLNLLPFQIEKDGSNITPPWLRGNITSLVADRATQFRFFGIRKHSATVVTIGHTHGKPIKIVIMNIKDFKRLYEEVIGTEEEP